MQIKNRVRFRIILIMGIFIFMLAQSVVNAAEVASIQNQMLIGGTVGIGTTMPLAKLHVSAETKESALRVSAQTEGDNLLVFDGARQQALRKFNNGDLKLVDLHNGRDVLRIYRNSDNVDVASGSLRVPNGRVAIGTDKTPATLTVNGNILAKEIEVVANVADYVFADDYELPALRDVDSFIKENRHLPGVSPATAADPRNQGEVVKLGERFRQLLEKTEELYLYTIDQETRIKQLEDKLY